ncbi:MAG: thioester reductase-like protein [Kiritimatiellia bacterium]|jgi:thioester reductase-like protein
MSAVLLTGFPGFIAGRLLRRLVRDRAPGTRFFLVVQSKFLFVARAKCQEIELEFAHFEQHWHLIEGDITEPSLGMTEQARALVVDRVREVWHLAALYDLAASQAVSYRVNVDGTQHVLDLCEQMVDLRSLHYISTCFVSGDRSGWVYEDELDEGQGFKNHYESTKFWAEKQVKRRVDRLPIVVYRPAIVVGDSRTGETAKADGPYYIMNLLMRLPKWAPMVNFGPSEAAVNLVPVDYVIDCMALLSTDSRALGRTFHLADPHPLSARELLERFCHHLGRAGVVGTLPQRVANVAIASRRVRQAIRIPRQSFDYFEHPVRYDIANSASLLRERTPPCPGIDDYIPQLVRFARDNPAIFQEVTA